MGLLLKTATPTPLPAMAKPKIPDNWGDFPIPTFQFSLSINGTVVALFQSVSGLSVRREVETIRQGGVNNEVYELPGQISYGHITLKSGFVTPEFFLLWMTSGQYSGVPYRDQVLTLTQRRSTTDKIEADFVTWQFEKAYPVSWSLSDLTVDDSQSIVMETLEVAFSYFTVEGAF